MGQFVRPSGDEASDRLGMAVRRSGAMAPFLFWALASVLDGHDGYPLTPPPRVRNTDSRGPNACPDGPRWAGFRRQDQACISLSLARMVRPIRSAQHRSLALPVARRSVRWIVGHRSRLFGKLRPVCGGAPHSASSVLWSAGRPHINAISISRADAAVTRRQALSRLPPSLARTLSGSKSANAEGRRAWLDYSRF